MSLNKVKKIAILIAACENHCHLNPVPYITKNKNEKIIFTDLFEECDGTLFVTFKNLNNRKKYDRMVDETDSLDFIHAIYRSIGRSDKIWLKKTYPHLF